MKPSSHATDATGEAGTKVRGRLSSEPSEVEKTGAGPINMANRAARGSCQVPQATGQLMAQRGGKVSLKYSSICLSFFYFF